MADFGHPISLRILFPFVKAFATLVFWLFAAPIRTLGRGRLPKSGALLVISNHISNTDPIVVQYACPRLVHFLARKELFNMGPLGWFIKWWRAVPIKQSSADKGAIKKAVELLREGRVVGIFPEGQLSPDGKLIELFEGTALIVRMAEATCVCVGLQGSNKLMPHPKVTPRWAFATIRANWGAPRKFTKQSTAIEIMDWIEAELRTLSGQS